jgi:hypothetical protein
VLGGSDDDGDNGGDGDGGDNTSVPDTVPDTVPDEDSEEAITGESYGYMAVETNSDNELTEITVYSVDPNTADTADTYDILNVETIYDDTVAENIDNATYSYVANGDADHGTDGTFDGFVVAADYNGDEVNPEADYGASTDSGRSNDADIFDLITDGTINVSKDGDTYTVAWEMTTENGETLAGSYEGPLDEVDGVTVQ